MIIKVTQDHIDRGIRFWANFCPLAYAISEAVKRYVTVDRLNVRISGRFIALPEEAKRFASLFDGGEPVKPFSFDLPL